MKRAWPSLEQAKGDISIVWIIFLHLAQSDEPNIHPDFGNVRKNQLDMPQTMKKEKIFPVM